MSKKIYGNLFIEGNTGIGTMSPSGKLHIVGSGGDSLVVTDNAHSSMYISHPNASQLDIRVDSNNFLTLSTGTTEWLRISNSTGVSLPTGFLNINSVNYTWPSSHAASSNYVLTSDTSGNLTWAAAASSISIGTTSVGSSTTGSVLYVDGSNNLAQNNGNFFWDDTNVRLIIRSPYGGALAAGAPLNVATSFGNASLALTDNSTSSFYVKHLASGFVFLTTDSGNGITFGSGSTENMRLTSGGSLGIGTPSPTALLDINSNTIRLRNARTVTNSTDSGDEGDIAWDSNFIYVCVATDTWKRSALVTY